jgi:hypothetical protein
MKTRRNAFVATLAGIFLALGSAVAFAADFSFPAANAGDKEALWHAVMVHFYGQYDPSRRCWAATISGDDYCMRPHRRDEATDGGVRHIFLVTAGPGPGEHTCHVCSGSMGLIVLAERGGNLVLAAKNDLVEQRGTFGEVESEEAFRVQKIAPAGSGWTVESSWQGQGLSVRGLTVYGLVGSEVRDLGYIPTFLDACETDEKPCGPYKFGFGFVETTAPFYDVELVLAPDSEMPQGPDRYRIPFDAQSMQYEVPGAVSELLFR